VRFDAYPREPRVLAGDVPEVDWLDVDGEPMQHSGWDFAEGRLLGLRRAVETGKGELELSLMLVNGTDEARSFVATPRDAAWRVVIDSERPDAPAAPLAGDSAEVGPHVVELAERLLAVRRRVDAVALARHQRLHVVADAGIVVDHHDPEGVAGAHAALLDAAHDEAFSTRTSPREAGSRAVVVCKMIPSMGSTFTFRKRISHS